MAQRRNQRIEVNNRENDLSLPFSYQLWPEIVNSLGITLQQARIIECILKGLVDKQIAMEIGITVSTVRSHLRLLFKHLGIEDRVQLVLRVWHTARLVERDLNGCH